jgi:cobalt-zinc-cadmium efflux system membrane fusion protein
VLALLLLAGPGAALASGGHERRDADEHAHHDADHAGDEHETPARFSVEDFERFGVRLATVAPGEVDIGIDLPGEVRPNADRIAHLAPRFPGIVREVRVNIGDRVRAGEVLALIESEHLATYELKAAFEGTVLDKHITPGEAVTRDAPCFVVADLSTVWVEVAVYQKALPFVRVGQRVRLSAGEGAHEGAGTISYIAPVVDQATRTATARVVLPNAEGMWRPGLFVTATVLTPEHAAIVVPRRALQTLDGNPVVFVDEAGRFAPRRVTVGSVGRTMVAIRDGVAAGERVADEHSFLVKAELAKGEAGHDH